MKCQPYETPSITRLIFYAKANKSFETSSTDRIMFWIRIHELAAALRHVTKSKGKQKSVLVLEYPVNKQLAVSLHPLSLKHSIALSPEPYLVDLECDKAPLQLPSIVFSQWQEMDQLSRITLPIKLLNDTCAKIAIIQALDDTPPLPGFSPMKMILLRLTPHYLEIFPDPNYRAKGGIRFLHEPLLHTCITFRESQETVIEQLQSFRDFFQFLYKQKTPKFVTLAMGTSKNLILRQEEPGLVGRQTHLFTMS